MEKGHGALEQAEAVLDPTGCGDTFRGFYLVLGVAGL
jgi:sugar/nucleoside kinase (ribokinase family)